MQSALTERQQWMQVLARGVTQLSDYEAYLKPYPYQVIRPAQIGMVMVRGRSGGQGQVFNLGEMTVTRCVIKLEDGRLGYSYIAGRHRQGAELAAVIDALLQGEEKEHLYEAIIAPLKDEQEQRKQVRQQEIQGSKVEFFTLVRGE